ncbi:MAG: FAD binding domain-containing protein [Sphingomonas sp.]|nr:FAD binding domain-containing protein [Sphingomonas sp.]
MRDFAYSVANSLDQAIAADGAHRMLIAGGTELLNWFRLGVAAPDHVVDLAGIEGLKAIESDGDRLTIGALATLAEVGENMAVRAHAAVLAQACLAAASPQIRNRATIGGNVLQKTRCAYFRAEEPLPWGCNKRHAGTGCAALEGINDRHAIFGWTEQCVAVQPSDPAVALASLDAEIEIAGPSARRIIPAATFHLTQREAADLGLDPAQAETRLQPGEVITGYRVPIRSAARSAYVKVRERASYEYALVSAAAVIELDQGVIARAAIALGSVAQKPWRLAEAEARIVGLPPTREALLPVLKQCFGDARPLADNGYKIAMAAGAATRAIVEAAA